MKVILRNILAFILSFLGGTVINMSIIKIWYKVLPLNGRDPNNMEVLAEIMPTLEFKYFLLPFMAHALGTLIGAVICGYIVPKHKMNFSLGFGLFSLLLGIIAVILIPAPTWFEVVDLILAYIPMAWLGGKIALKLSINK